jgi:dihydroorotate dehydrogenase electron transfer subunit
MIDAVATVERNDLTFSASSRSYGLLRLRLEKSLQVLPGQFAMLKPRGQYEPLLRRAMAFYRSELSNDSAQVEFIYQILGRGTQSLAQLKAGDEVELLGSLGNTFDVEAANEREVFLVAGGAGSPALFMLAEKLLGLNLSVKLFIGGANRGDLCGLEDFVALLSADNVISATIDGSHGEKGFVTAPLESRLQMRRGQRTIIYACGPDPMLHAVAKLAEQYDVPAQLSLEAPMGCGYGVCVGCAVAVKHECPESFVYKKVCTDGPVFWSNELHW